MRRHLLRLLNVFRRERAEHELAREMDAHLALLEDEHVSRGLTREDARLAARRAMGSVALTKDLHRDARSFGWLDDARQDVRFAGRMLVRRKTVDHLIDVMVKKSNGAQAAEEAPKKGRGRRKAEAQEAPAT